MKTKNEEKLNRTIGILEGLAFAKNTGINDAISYVIEKLEEVLADERENGKGHEK